MKNHNAIIRMFKYQKALLKLKKIGFINIFSENIAEETNINSSQIRKDFSIFDIYGKKRGGYHIETLITSINKIINYSKEQKVIIAGVGKIGKALINYKNFYQEGIKVIAGFDLKASNHLRVKVYPIETMKSFIKKEQIKIGILSVPEKYAEEIALFMYQAGIKGILNFTPIELQSKEDFLVHNIDLKIEMKSLFYQVECMEKSSSLHTFST